MPRPNDGKKSLRLPDAEFHVEFCEIKSLRKIKYSRRSPDPENFRCGHQQPYNFFSVFANFRTLPDVSEKIKNCSLEGEKLAVTEEKNFPIILKVCKPERGFFIYMVFTTEGFLEVATGR